MKNVKLSSCSLKVDCWLHNSSRKCIATSQGETNNYFLFSFLLFDVFQDFNQTKVDKAKSRQKIFRILRTQLFGGEIMTFIMRCENNPVWTPDSPFCSSWVGLLKRKEIRSISLCLPETRFIERETSLKTFRIKTHQ